MLRKIDPEIAAAIQQENERQRDTLELIASENFVSDAVLEAQGCIMTNKYAEGYPSKRYYGGCENVDIVETLAIERAKQLFGAEHANVQPHSGSQANMGVYFALLDPGDTILGMALTCGGHLTHGLKVNFSGVYYNAISYGVNRETEMIDCDEVQRLAEQHKPKLIVAGGSAYPRIIDFVGLRKVADSVGARFMVDMAHFCGLVAAGVHPSPVPHSHFVTSTTHKTMRGPRGGLIFCKKEFAERVDRAIFPGIQGGPLMHVIAAKAVALKESMTEEFKVYQAQILKNATRLGEVMMANGYRLVAGGTDTHLILVDLSSQAMTGKEAEIALDIAGITVNKNVIPFDKQTPFVTSGIRIGTPAVTTRGMKEPEMDQIGAWIVDALKHRENETHLKQIKKNVTTFCRQFPVHLNNL